LTTVFRGPKGRLRRRSGFSRISYSVVKELASPFDGPAHIDLHTWWR
jgi:hypothetical protein